jgi:hypothetical protein
VLCRLQINADKCEVLVRAPDLPVFAPPSLSAPAGISPVDKQHPERPSGHIPPPEQLEPLSHDLEGPASHALASVPSPHMSVPCQSLQIGDHGLHALGQLSVSMGLVPDRFHMSQIPEVVKQDINISCVFCDGPEGEVQADTLDFCNLALHVS